MKDNATEKSAGGPSVCSMELLGDSEMTEQRLTEIEEGYKDSNLKMWDGARGTIEELCLEVRRLRKRDVQWCEKWKAAVDTAVSWMEKA